MAAFNVCSQQINDFLCSQFCPFSAFSASRSAALGSARQRSAASRHRSVGWGPHAPVAATDDTGFDAHLAEALGEEEMSDHCSSSSEEDENNEAVS